MNTTPDLSVQPRAGIPALLYAARIETCERVADLFDEQAVTEADDQCTAWFDADRDAAILEYFCPSRAEAEHRLMAMRAVIETCAPGESYTGSVRELPVENWAEAWKKFFHAEKVSDRIWIKPSWEPCAAQADDIIVEIDPGMSFGTGQHGTTRGCLRFMDTLAAHRSGLSLTDVGCGSGILAIAAAKLGYTQILATDCDPDAVRIAGENARRNGVHDRIGFALSALGDGAWPRRFDVVVANILATVLIAQAAALVRGLSADPAARLILSGILNPQAEGVLEAFVPHGLALESRIELGEWTTLSLRRSVTGAGEKRP